MQNPVGAVEPRRGCEGGGGGTGAVQVAWPTAFAASLKLDSYHRGIGFVGQTSVHKSIATSTNLTRYEDQLWELSSPSEAAKAAAQALSKLPDSPLSQPR